MTHYILRRGLQSVLLLWVTTIIVFTIYQLAPGGPLQFLDDDPKRSQADINRLERLYGVDRTIPVQYISWLLGEDWLPHTPYWQGGRCINDPDRCSRGIVRLDFGRSFYYQGESVLDVIAQRIPATFLLAFSSLVLGIVVGVPLGIISALNRNKWPDNLTRVSTVLINTVPEWWIGLLALIVLGGYLRLV